MNHDLAARRYVQAADAKTVGGVGIRDVERSMVFAVGVSAIDPVQPFRRPSVSLTFFRSNRVGPETDVIGVKHLAVSEQRQLSGRLLNQHLIRLQRHAMNDQSEKNRQHVSGYVAARSEFPPGPNPVLHGEAACCSKAQTRVSVPHWPSVFAAVSSLAESNVAQTLLSVRSTR